MHKETSTITQVKHGQVADKYQPIANPLACFKAAADDAFQGYCEHTYFIVYTAATRYSTYSWRDMVEFLASQLQFASKVRAYSSLSDLGDETYVELDLGR